MSHMICYQYSNKRLLIGENSLETLANVKARKSKKEVTLKKNKMLQ